MSNVPRLRVADRIFFVTVNLRRQVPSLPHRFGRGSWKKLPIRRPRVRSQRGEMKLGSYEQFRLEEAMQRYRVTLTGKEAMGGRPRIGQANPKTGQPEDVIVSYLLASKGLISR